MTESGLDQALDDIGAYVVRQRWSGAIGRVVREVRILDALRIEEIETPTFFTVTRVSFDDGLQRDYALPLGHRPVGDPLAERAPDFMIGGLAGDTPRFLYDAIGDPEYVRWLWRSAHRELRLQTAVAALRFRVFDAESLERDLDPPLRVLGVEQSNTSMILGEGTFLKHLRRVEPGPSQELDMLAALGRAGFRHTAPLQAAALYEPPDAAPTPVVLIQPFLHNGTEGWTLALTSLRMLYAESEDLAVALGSGERRAAVEEHGGVFAPEASRLGAVVAEMHRALAAPDLGDGFSPEPVATGALRSWAEEMTCELDALLARPDPALEQLRPHRDEIAARFAAVRSLAPTGQRIRIHGDLHLGQSMRTDSGWIILDFEGEPDRTPAQRRRKTSPLIDVAGMLRSFDYAAAVALAERILPQSADWEGMLAYGEAWAQACREAFWASYLATAGDSDLVPDPAAAAVLRRAFEMQKAVYETSYELGHRPSWAAIPIRFLLRSVS
ncbi:MAG TPA: hypothetical protein VF155_09815 [Candidatus Dormibacteraeota bacterium]